MRQGIGHGDRGGVVETPLVGGGLDQENVGEFLRQHGGEAGFVGQHVNQAAAEHDGMADGEHFERAGEHDAATNFGLHVEIVANFQVVDDGFENFVGGAGGSEQAGGFGAIGDVGFRLGAP